MFLGADFFYSPRENPADLIRRIREKDGKYIWICGGASVIRQLMAEDLIDVYHVSVIPVLLGSGIRLFDEQKRKVPLRLISNRVFNGMVDLRYVKGE